MRDEDAANELVRDLNWQIDQMRPRGIKNDAGKPYAPAHFKRGLDRIVEEDGPLAAVDYVRKFVHKQPTDAYKRLAAADAADLACEALVIDETKPYAKLFTDEDRTVARTRLSPHIKKIEEAAANRRALKAAARDRIRGEGLPKRHDLDGVISSRRRSERRELAAAKRAESAGS